MKKNTVLLSFKRSSAIFQAAVLALASLLPVLLLTSNASADQLDNRYIDMSGNQTSDGSGRDGTDAFGQDVTYRVGFELSQAHANIRGIVVEFCTNSPIYGDACTGANGSGFNLNTGTLAVTAVSGITGTWLIDGASDNDTLILTQAGGNNLAGGASVSFDLGTTAPADGITNPTTNGTFYARIATYDVVANAQGYTSANPDAVGAHLDEGGIALAVANELTVTARVQEVLEFCIGTEDDSITGGWTSATGDSCLDVSGTDLDLGVVDSNSVQKTSDTDIGLGGDGNDGLALIRTNALNGAVIYYKAEMDGATTSANGGGTLRQAGSANCTVIASVANTCFNSAGGDITNPTAVALPFGTELFGMALTSIDNAGGATSNLSCDAQYNGGNACNTTPATTYAWDPTGAFDTIASSSLPMDDEHVNIEFAATASATTPTGLYTVVANFVATSTF